MIEEILAEEEEHANDMKTLLEWVRGSNGKSEAEVIAALLRL
jgi:bacterioferritin (cytochrome b1)